MVGGDWRVGLLLCIKCVVELILHNFHVGSHRRLSLTVKISVEERRQGRLVAEMDTPNGLLRLNLPVKVLTLPSPQTSDPLFPPDIHWQR